LRGLGAERYSGATVAKGARKLRRAANRQDTAGKDKKKQLAKPMVVKAREMPPDPLKGEALKKLLTRLAIPLVAVWLIGGLIAGVSFSSTAKTIALVVPAVVTLVLVGIVVWAVRQAKKARGVAGILSNVENADDRKAALEELDKGFKKKDPAAIFARAQLELQEDPKQALATLEQINLSKVLAPVADEARAQRSMIHLMLGQVNEARRLADGIDLSRHNEAKSRAMMASVIAEAWARSGQAKKAVDTLEVFDPDDEEFVELKPQLWRAYAYAYAYSNNTKGMRKALRKLLEQDVRLLGGFLAKRAHPLLMKEAKKLLEQSGQMPRKMVVQRR
jgi:tetratricopeptide (TPR) repeat protein